MNKYEKEEISRLPSQYRPLGAWGYFGYSILFNIPVIGFILLLVFSFSGSNINRRSFARSYFCGFIIALIIIGILAVAFGPAILTYVKGIISQISGK